MRTLGRGGRAGAAAYARRRRLDLPGVRPRARARSGASTPSCTRGVRSTRCARRRGGGATSRCSSTGSTTCTRSSATRSRRSRAWSGCAVTVSLTYEAGRAALGARAEVVEELRPLRRARARAAGARRALRRRRRGPRFTTSSATCSSPRRERVDPGDARAAARGRRRARRGRARRRRGARAAARRASPARRSSSSTARSRRAASAIERVFAQYGIAVADRAPGAVRAHRRSAAGCWRSRAARCSATQARAEDLLDYLRSPGLLERPELADGLEAEVRRRGAAHAPPQARERLGWTLGEIDALRAAPTTRRRSSPARPGGCSPRRTAGARRLVEPAEELDAHALATMLRGAGGARRARRATAGRRADRAARGARACPTARAARARRGAGRRSARDPGAAVSRRCSCAGCRRASSRWPDRARAVPVRRAPPRAGRLQRPAARARATTRWRASATCSTPASRAPPSGSCSATAAPTRRATSRCRRRSSPTSPSCSMPDWPERRRRRLLADVVWPRGPGADRARACAQPRRPRRAPLAGERASRRCGRSSRERAAPRPPQRDPVRRRARDLRRLPGQVAGRARAAAGAVRARARSDRARQLHARGARGGDRAARRPGHAGVAARRARASSSEVLAELPPPIAAGRPEAVRAGGAARDRGRPAPLPRPRGRRRLRVGAPRRSSCGSGSRARRARCRRSSSASGRGPSGAGRDRPRRRRPRRQPPGDRPRLQERLARGPSYQGARWHVRAPAAGRAVHARGARPARARARRRPLPAARRRRSAGPRRVPRATPTSGAGCSPTTRATQAQLDEVLEDADGAGDRAGRAAARGRAAPRARTTCSRDGCRYPGICRSQ